MSLGQYAQGVELNYTEPFFLDQRLAAGFDAYSKVTDATTWQYYSELGDRRHAAPGRSHHRRSHLLAALHRLHVAADHPEHDEPAVQRLQLSDVGDAPGGSGVSADRPQPDHQYTCLTNGEASLALKQAQGNWVTSMVGYTLSYTTLDNPRDPHQGFSGNIKQDVAGVGGDSEFVRPPAICATYHELYFDNLVGIARVQGGNITA